jgi:RNA 2',3'-cyclic 3'-phosphodiesterase
MARTRTFIGVDVGAEIRRAAGDVQASLARSGAAVKWAEEVNLHVTLLFLGDVDDRDLMNVCRIVSKAAATEAPFPLSVAGIGAFPTPRRPKVVWGGITDGLASLVRLHAAMEQPLFDLGCYRREERAYTPHLTLGRTDSEADGQILAAELPKYLTWSGGQSMVDEVLVYSSELRKGKPEYTVLARSPLGGEE